MKIIDKLILLLEKTKIIPWDGNPTIGWWEDASPLIMYHGTHKSNVDAIFTEGLKASSKGHTKGWISLAFEPNTSFGYASMGGGEVGFRNNPNARHIPADERAVLVFKFKNVSELKKLGWNSSNTDIKGAKQRGPSGGRIRLIDKSLYDNQNAPDQQYYALLELQIKGPIPPKNITGVMFKK